MLRQPSLCRCQVLFEDLHHGAFPWGTGGPFTGVVSLILGCVCKGESCFPLLCPQFPPSP